MLFIFYELGNTKREFTGLWQYYQLMCQMPLNHTKWTPCYSQTVKQIKGVMARGSLLVCHTNQNGCLYDYSIIVSSQANIVNGPGSQETSQLVYNISKIALFLWTCLSFLTDNEGHRLGWQHFYALYFAFMMIPYYDYLDSR